jgi:RNA polymerase sigma-70 factor (ECF subfamily)
VDRERHEERRVDRLGDADRVGRFEAVYATTFTAILGYALRRCAVPEDAADVVAETFATAWRRIDDLPPGDRGRLWLYGVARNVLANHRRGSARRDDLSTALAAQLTGRYERPPDEELEAATILRLLNELPPTDREVLTLVAWEGLDHGEIAEVLDCSRNSVRLRLHRARRRLAARLAAAGITTGLLSTAKEIR